MHDKLALFLAVLLFVVGTQHVALGSSEADNDSCSSTPGLSIPSKFSAELEVESHLIDKEVQYPPRIKVAHIHYDFEGKRAKANITVGYDAGVTYIRRYDLSSEFMLDQGPYPQCKRSYLGEKMPIPAFSSSFLAGAVLKGSSVTDLPSCTRS